MSISIIISVVMEIVRGTGSRESSPSANDKPMSPGFDWDKMIEWAWSFDSGTNGVERQSSIPIHESVPQSLPPGIGPQETLTHSQHGPGKGKGSTNKKRKRLSAKERYTAEKLKEINHASYLKIKKDPIKWKTREDARKKRYHEKKEKLATLTEAELKEEHAKQRAIKDRRNYLARFRRNPNARVEPKQGFILSDRERAKCRERTRICRLRKKLNASKNPD